MGSSRLHTSDKYIVVVKLSMHFLLVFYSTCLFSYIWKEHEIYEVHSVGVCKKHFCILRLSVNKDIGKDLEKQKVVLGI